MERKPFHIIECQLIKFKGIIELENHHLYTLCKIDNQQGPTVAQVTLLNIL